MSSVVLQDSESTSTIMVASDKIEDTSRRWPIQCSGQYAEEGKSFQGCTPVQGGTCDRLVTDDFLTEKEVARLIKMAEVGMSRSITKKKLGPTIMDINSGWVLPPSSHQPSSIYSKGQLYSPEDYELYKDVTQRLKKSVEETFNVKNLYFTAPTFITREVGSMKWKPKTMHDEYWHPHVDKNNTGHYDYSGLIYLSTHGTDFQGGELHFYDHSNLDCSKFVGAFIFFLFFCSFFFFPPFFFSFLHK